MNAKQNERLVKAAEGIAKALTTLAKLESKRLNKEYPPERKPQDAEVFKRGEQEQGEIETETRPIPGRFEKGFLSARQGTQAVSSSR